DKVMNRAAATSVTATTPAPIRRTAVTAIHRTYPGLRTTRTRRSGGRRLRFSIHAGRRRRRVRQREAQDVGALRDPAAAAIFLDGHGEIPPDPRAHRLP